MILIKGPNIFRIHSTLFCNRLIVYLFKVSKTSDGLVSSELTVENIDWSDTGVYQCKAGDGGDGLIEGDLAHLVVHSKPKNTGEENYIISSFSFKIKTMFNTLLYTKKRVFFLNKTINALHLFVFKFFSYMINTSNVN